VLPSVLLALSVARQEEHRACKKSSEVAGTVICLEQDAHGLHVVQLMPLPLLHSNPDWFNLAGASYTQIVLEKRPLALHM